MFGNLINLNYNHRDRWHKRCFIMVIIAVSLLTCREDSLEEGLPVPRQQPPRHHKAIITVILGICLSMVMQGCATYRAFPTDKVNAPPPEKQYRLLQYNISGGSIVGGANELREIMRSNTPFEEAERVEEKPDKGYFVQVHIHSVPPSFGTFVFGYLSVSTLAFLPAWSTQDGYNIYYEVYKDGERLKTLDYQIRRSAFLWIVMLPLVWVNLFTYSEADAFRATTYQFFEDAKPLFNTKHTWQTTAR